MSESYISVFSLEFYDPKIEEAFQRKLINLEARYISIFIGLLVFFNSLYLIADLILPSSRALISIQFQGFVVIPFYTILFFLFKFNRSHIDRYNILAIALCLFTIGSQMTMLILNEGTGDGMKSIMIVAVVSSYFFAGVNYKFLLYFTPLIIISMVLALILEWNIGLVSLIQVLMLYMMIFVGVLLIKYRSEYHHRKDFYKTKIIEDDGEVLKATLKKVNSLSGLRKNIISVLAHDIKSPLSNLQSILQLTQNETITIDETKSYFNKLEQQVKSVNFLVNDILVWVKSQSEEAEMEWMSLDLNNCFEDITFIFKQVLEEKRIQLVSGIKISEINCQPEMIKAVLRNLVSNAIKFSQEGSIITLSSEKVEGKIRLSVADQGVGMNSEQLAKLKHTFSSSMGTHMEPGTGLGLKICQTLVHAHHSQLRIDSNINKGTRISFDLAQ